MKLIVQPMFTLRLQNSVAALVIRSTVLFFRCVVLSLFIWVASFNIGRDFQGETIIVGLAKALAYPVYLVEKPLLNFYGPPRCLRIIPENFGFIPSPIPLTQIVPPELQGPWKPDGIYIKETPFFNRGFTCNLASIALIYFSLFSSLKWVLSRLRPNP